MRYRFSFDRSHWIDRAARLGHVATGSVYLVVGAVAFVAVFDARWHPMGSQGALHAVFAGRIGAAALLGIAAGMAVDFVWQIVRAVTNADMASHTLKGTAERAGWALSGCIHLGLAITAVKLAFGVPQESAERRAKIATSRVMSLPLGEFAITATGAMVVLVGFQMIRRAWVADVDPWLDLGSLRPTTRNVILGLGCFGLAARGLLFCTGGVFLALAGIKKKPWSAQALGGTLRAVHDAPLGPTILALISAGLIAFGVIELVSARFRRIRVPIAAD